MLLTPNTLTLAALAEQVDLARSEGRLAAFAEAMTQCCKLSKRSDATDRTWQEIHHAIDILHLNELHKIASNKAKVLDK